MPIPFRQHRDVLSKSPAPAHELAGREPGKRQAGWPFSLVIFLFGHAPRKEKVTRAPKALESC